MPKDKNPKKYDLEERTAKFAEDIVEMLERNVSNTRSIVTSQ